MSKQPGGYPRQNAYPQQPQQYYQGMPQQHYQQYPQQQMYAPGQPMQQTGYGIPQASYGVPPPPYTAIPPQLPAYPTHQMQPRQPVGMMPMVQGNFDAGARFHQGVPPVIPPTPPGCPPTGAQMAAAHGQSVAMTQNQSTWLGGGSDGGYTKW